MYVCMYVCMHACMHAWIYVCMHACMHLFMYVCMYACMHACMQYVCTIFENEIRRSVLSCIFKETQLFTSKFKSFDLQHRVKNKTWISYEIFYVFVSFPVCINKHPSIYNIQLWRSTQTFISKTTPSVFIFSHQASRARQARLRTLYLNMAPALNRENDYTKKSSAI